MKKNSLIVVLIILGLSPIGYSNAQEIDIELSGNMVSSYVWRGFKQAGASIQPSLSIDHKGLYLSAWASTDIAGNDKKEIDFTLGYKVPKFSFYITDYWWDGEFANRYFSSPKDDNFGHLLEASIAYTLSKSYPLLLTWNTFLLGHGNQKSNGKNSYSTYIEASYPFTVNKFNLSASLGIIPWKSIVYGSDMNGLKLTMVKIGISKDISINEKFSVPIFAEIIANPAVEDMHFVLGFTIR